MPISAKALVSIACLYAGYALFCFFIQRHLLFPRHHIDSSPNLQADTVDRETLWLETGFGKVEAWYLTARSRPPRDRIPALIYAHGNAERIDSWPQMLGPFRRMGLAVLLVEYPGYGRSGGDPSQSSIRETFIAARSALLKKPEIDPHRLVYFGRSLGGGAVCVLTGVHPPAALILMSAFTGVKPYARQFFVPSFLIRDPFDNLSAVGAFAGPTLIVHGRFDTVVPYEHGRALHRAAPNSTLITYDCGHNDCPPDWVAFGRQAQRFLTQAGILRSKNP